MSSFTFFSLQKKLLVLVLSTTLISISITTVLFLNFDNITIFQFQENIILIGISLMIGLSILTYFLSKRLSGPITQLSAATRRISQGDFSVRTNIKSRDEIGSLSESFDYMVTKLQEAEITIKQKEEVIQQQEDILLKFSQHAQNDCVGVIDMKDSTKISAKLSDEDVTKLYEIFLNFMAKIVRNYNGEVVKNIGDALMFRFPNTNLNDDSAMKNILECCLNMIESHGVLKEKLEEEKMPELNYKISISYGSVKVAQSTTSTISDIFGPTVNRCFKINSLCPENSLIIDNNLYETLKNFDEYDISQLSETEINQKYGYTIFQVKRMTGF
jgi:class 3 adenylate cyclase|tara:strand:- start:264 stop:1250 length:987 start_codon:yes stop_codon:yes gene_type:complete